MNSNQKLKIYLYGSLATISLLLFYFLIVGSISGLKFAETQFAMYWYFITATSVGFGIQIGLYIYLKELVKNSNMSASPETVAVTGTTSALSMISCCAHYLVNIVPILGISGALAVIAQYQIGIFWVGITFNLFGIAFIVSRIIKFKKHL